MKKIDIIQLLRLFGAVNIFIYHSGIVGDYGYYGVEIFSIISGYILMYSTQNRNSVKFFFRKRLIRILPLYWCATMVMFLAVYKVPSISIMSEAKMEYLIKSLLFIPFVNSKGYNVPIVGVGWTLNYEMLFYCIFFIAIHISFKYRGILSVSMIIVLVFIGYCIDFSNYFMHYYTNYFMLEFALGIVAFYVVEHLRKMNSETLFRQYCLALGGGGGGSCVNDSGCRFTGTLDSARYSGMSVLYSGYIIE